MVGSFKPIGEKTAHQRLAKAAKIDIDHAVAGSIKEDGSIELRSESINRRNFDRCDIAGTEEGEDARARIARGDYVTRGKGKTSK